MKNTENTSMINKTVIAMMLTHLIRTMRELNEKEQFAMTYNTKRFRSLSLDFPGEFEELVLELTSLTNEIILDKLETDNNAQ